MKAEDFKNEDSLKAYFKQIKKTNLLTFEEELNLSRRIQGGDELAKQKLIESNLRLVVKIAKAYATPEMNFLDIVQEGNLGLIKAASKYDHKKNVRFSTYAAWWIRQSILRSLSNKKRPIRLPYRKEETLKRIKRSYYSLNQRLNRKPTIAEVAKDINLKEETVSQLLNMGGIIVSLDSELSHESGNMMEVYEDYTYDPDKEIMDKCLKEDTLKFLEHLMEKERKILMYRFAFYGGKKYTLKTIGEELGISPETVRQIEIRAIKKLREHADEVREYMYEPVAAGPVGRHR
ncbi:MAG: sigma-70 family RNA polymerase sigma factor [Spirochaetales bacterium]|nr:sigma-70 family RNA polymerase sigma factor [Spirochaetales bacterium]